jgi:DNA repair protein RecO (recombination protein O)
MIINTEAIVLKRFPFGETSMIARCFTREKGKVSIMVRGARRKKPHNTSFFQPLNYLDLIYYFNPKRNIQTASKVSYKKVWSKFQNNLKLLSYGLALMELTDKSITDYDPHPDLFDELVSVLCHLENKDKNRNLVFWFYEMQLLTLLGFKPDLDDEDESIYGLPSSTSSENSITILKSLQSHSLDKLPDFPVKSSDRKVIGSYLTGHIRSRFEFAGPLHSFEFMKKIQF